MYHGDGRTSEQVAQKGCGITTFGDTKKFTGQVSQQPDLTEPALCRGLEMMTSRSPFQAQFFYDSVTMKGKKNR